MSARGVMAVTAVECAKLRAQSAVQGLLSACLVGPIAFVEVVRLQSSLPEDTLFGRAMRDSGFAAPLVVLGFAALWLLPAVASVIGGDVFASEDRHRTWTTVLTRSRSRREVFAGKVLASLAFTAIAIAVLALASLAAGLVLVGRQPLVDLSGALLPPARALGAVLWAWVSVLPPAFAFVALAVLVSVATRSGAAGVGLPVLAALTMQLCALVDGAEIYRRLLLTSGFSAWHGLLHQQPYYRPLLDAAAVSVVWFVGCVTAAYRLLQRRDIQG